MKVVSNYDTNISLANISSKKSRFSQVVNILPVNLWSVNYYIKLIVFMYVIRTFFSCLLA